MREKGIVSNLGGAKLALRRATQGWQESRESIPDWVLLLVQPVFTSLSELTLLIDWWLAFPNADSAYLSGFLTSTIFLYISSSITRRKPPISLKRVCFAGGCWFVVF
jgi:hypothetical protein